MSTYQTIDVSFQGPVGRLVLNRPERGNALSPEMLSEVAAACDRLSRAEDVRAVVVTGAGPRFSVGFDLDAWPEESTPISSSTAEMGAAAAHALRTMRPVTVAALRGRVVGGGAVLALACDLRLAADGTVFSIPEVDLGIPLGWFGVPLLVREVGPAIAKELIMTCRPFDADEARSLGMLNGVVSGDELDAAADRLAIAIAHRPAWAIDRTKRHVDAATWPQVGSWDDPAGTLGLIGAFSDPEAMAAAREYLDALRSR